MGLGTRLNEKIKSELILKFLLWIIGWLVCQELMGNIQEGSQRGMNFISNTLNRERPIGYEPNSMIFQLWNIPV